MRKLTNTEFIERANKLHNNKYDYSKTYYNGASNNILIICKEHGEFQQRADMHVFKNGQGCPKCANNIKYTLNDFIEKSNKIHNNKYDYSKVNYKSNKSLIKIICPEHGEFEQRADIHLFGTGCPKCGILNIVSNTVAFITSAKKIHNNKFDYSKVDYKHSKEFVTIICPTHGEFKQIPNGHLNGNGCQQCNIEQTSSKAEKEIFDFIYNEKNKFEILSNNKEILNNGQELDIYIPGKQLAIEFNGLYWHSELKKELNYHINKTNICESKGIQLIHIFEDEWIEKQEIVKSRLKNLLNQNINKIYARKCIIKNVDLPEMRRFLIENHIQGYVGGKYYFGLYFNNELVALMTFGNLRKNLGNVSIENEYELLRFCCKLNTNVIGGASKLFKHFLKIHNPHKIISYADRRWSKGNLYDTLGFSFIKNTVPNYFYIFGQTRKNRYNFRKDVLISKYGCSETDTEHNFCFNQGWFRIYDCGTKLYEFINI